MVHVLFSCVKEYALSFCWIIDVLILPYGLLLDQVVKEQVCGRQLSHILTNQHN